METIQKGKQTNKQATHAPVTKVNKQTNKQTSRGSTCRGADAGGSAELHNMRSPIHNASEYAEELQRCIRDVSEKHGVQYAGSYSDITPLLRGTSSSQVTHMAWGGGRGVAKVEISHDIVGRILVRCKTHLQVPDSRV